MKNKSIIYYYPSKKIQATDPQHSENARKFFFGVYYYLIEYCNYFAVFRKK